MKRAIFIWMLFLMLPTVGAGQVGNNGTLRILFRGIVRDAATELPLNNTQIFVNRDFISSTDSTGTFSFRVRGNDSILFTNLGYKVTLYHVSDTLFASELMAGVYMTSDTITLAEVVIIPRRPGLRSEILNSPIQTTPERENARYNMQVASYQGRVAQGRLGDPESNYGLLRQQFARDAREKGQIRSDQMVGISPLTVIPMIYLLLKGLPEKPVPLRPNLTKEELNQINRVYLDSIRARR